MYIGILFSNQNLFWVYRSKHITNFVEKMRIGRLIWWKSYTTIAVLSSICIFQLLLKRKRFALWLIHKLLWIRAQKPLSTEIEGAQQSCQKNITFVLKIAGLQDSKLFCLIVEKCLILLHGKQITILLALLIMSYGWNSAIYSFELIHRNARTSSPG